MEAPDRRRAARAAYTLGELAELRGDVQALSWYRRSLLLDPGGRFAARARRRVEVLGEREAPVQSALARFERVKKEALQMGPSKARAAVESLLESLGGSGAERAAAVDMSLWLIRDDLEVQGRAEAAVERAVTLLGGAHGSPEQMYRACRLALRAVGDGDPGPLILALEAYNSAHPEHVEMMALTHDARDLRWRRRARRASWAALAALALLFLGRRSWRAFGAATLRAWRPWRGIAFIGYVFGAAGLMAELWAPGYREVFWGCGGALMAVHVLVGAVHQAAPAGPGLRALIALVATSATLAACFEVLSAFDKQALMGM